MRFKDLGSKMGNIKRRTREASLEYSPGIRGCSGERKRRIPFNDAENPSLIKGLRRGGDGVWRNEMTPRSRTFLSHASVSHLIPAGLCKY